jgi:hypothetical protein
MALKIACAGYVREDGKELGLHRPDDFPANHKPAMLSFGSDTTFLAMPQSKTGNPCFLQKSRKVFRVGVWGDPVKLRSADPRNIDWQKKCKVVEV